MSREMKEGQEQEQEQEFPGAESEPAFVTAMFAGNRNEAERCRELLQENGIPAELGDPDEGPKRRGAGIPLLVPEPLLESASEILSARSDESDESGIDDAAESADDDEDVDDDFDDDYDDEDEFEAEDEDAWDSDDDDVEEDEDYD
jgi:hypothetical protein